MKHTLFALFTFLILSYSTTNAQSIQLLAGNTLNGAMNGTLLGGATMALSNSDDFSNLRVGLGLGTLYGIGMGGYDIIHGKGNEILVSGLFNDGNNSSIIVLLDTFYGAAAGSIIVTSVMLVANEPLIDGLQYGSAIGAWVGFGFGIFDTVFLARRSTNPLASIQTKPDQASGLVGIALNDASSFGFISPRLTETLELTNNSFNRSINTTVDLVNFKIIF